MRKANLKIKDDFHEQLTLGDIDHLRRARFYLIITPLTFLGAVHFMNKMRENGGFSKHFRNMFQRARSSYASKNEATWERASQGYKEKSTDSNGKPEPVKDIYKEVIKERQAIKKAETESKLVVPVAKHQVRNTDPFERKRRLAMGINTHAKSAQDADLFKASKILSAAEARKALTD